MSVTNAAALPQRQLQGRDVAEADKDLRVSADEPIIEGGEKTRSAVSAAGAEDCFDIAVREHLVQVPGPVPVRPCQIAILL